MDNESLGLVLRLQQEEVDLLRLLVEAVEEQTDLASRELHQQLTAAELQLLDLKSFEENSVQAQPINPTLDMEETQNTSAPSGIDKSPFAIVSCSTCDEEIPRLKMKRLQCGCDYCDQCIKFLFELSLKHDDLFPPKCCQEVIPVDSVIALLKPETREAIVAKKEEFDTEDPTYCSNKSCQSTTGSSLFVPRRYIRDNLAKCPRCNTNTCTFCKDNEHPGACSKDPGFEVTLDLAQQEGWRRCSQCGHLLELSRGCNHMTCICSHQFCYICGVQWKRCKCPQWQERMLLDPAERNANEWAVPGIHDWLFADEFFDDDNDNRDAENDLLLNQACNHNRWNRIDEPDRMCAICNDHMRGFIYECRNCQMFACVRCRREIREILTRAQNERRGRNNNQRHYGN